MRLSAIQQAALQAANVEALWRPLRREGCWNVDHEVARQVQGVPLPTGFHLNNVMVNTQRSLEKRGLVKVTQGSRIDPYRVVFGGQHPRVAVSLLTLTREGIRFLKTLTH